MEINGHQFHRILLESTFRDYQDQRMGSKIDFIPNLEKFWEN